MRRCISVGMAAVALLAACATPFPPVPEVAFESTATPAPSARPLWVADHAYVQTDRGIDFGFTVRNPNTGVGIRASEYRIVAYAEDGTALGSTTGWIAHVAPDTVWGVGGRFRVEALSPVSRLDVQVTTGEAVPDFPSPDFVVDGVTIFRDDEGVRVTGVIHNPYRLGVTYVYAGAVFYDEEGRVVGGTMTYLDYIPGSGRVGVEVSAAAAGPVAKVGFYASGSAITQQLDPAAWPSGAAAPVLLEHGFGQQGRSLTWAGVVQNPSDGPAIKTWVTVLTVYDADGTVLAAGSLSGAWLLAGQTLGVVETYTLREGQEAERVVVEMAPLAFVPPHEAAGVPVFTVKDVIYEADARFPKVVGRVVNPMDRSLTYIKAIAVLYDAAGTIVGGGTAYIDFVPAQGPAAVSVRVSGATATATRAELSATVTSLSGQ